MGSQRGASRPVTRRGSDEGPAQLVRLGGGEVGTRWVVKDGARIGRDACNEVCLVDPEVSRSHARVFRTPTGNYMVEDLGSRNGTTLNGTSITRAPVNYGDRIGLGAGTVLLFARRDQLQDQIVQLQKIQALGQLAGGIAHDFNNVLASILANSTWVQEVPGVPAEVRQAMQEIELAAKRAGDITRQLLTFARANTGERHGARVLDLVNDAKRLLARTIPRSVELKTEVDPELAVVVDPHRLSQVIMNLCINAVHAMPNGGTLTISASPRRIERMERNDGTLLAPGAYMELSVQDTGVGIAPEVIGRVFDPFFTTKPGNKGTGLGLATAYRVAKDHGGTIEVDSTLGEGSCFHLLLPAGEPVEETKPQEARTHSRPIVHGHILVVDDDELVAKGTTAVLQRGGFDVTTVYSGAEAVLEYERNGDAISLVVLDLDMPVMPGEQVLERLLAMDPNANVTICTGYLDDERRERLLRVGARSFLQKPFDCSTLREHVIRALIQSDPDTTTMGE